MQTMPYEIYDKQRNMVFIVFIWIDSCIKYLYDIIIKWHNRYHQRNEYSTLKNVTTKYVPIQFTNFSHK